MKSFAPFTVNPLNWDYHSKDNFREQMSVLRVVGDTRDGCIKLIRSFWTVGTSGMSGFDNENPGTDTEEGWKILDSLIENNFIHGTFHTHPSGVYDFSAHDWRSIKGLAKANGSKPIFHGVQAQNSDNAHFICAQMIASQVYIHDLGWHDSNLNDPVILLPGPLKIHTSDSLVIIPSIN